MARLTNGDALTDEERFLFDLRGFLVVKNVLSAKRCRELIRLADEAWPREDGDGGATIADGNRVVLYVWYDNEFGYACQVVRVVQKWAGIRYPLIPGDVARTGFDELCPVAAG